jgi:predicted adenine nucleotide alpha hydrolase (AANH) superfamily ATPase
MKKKRMLVHICCAPDALYVINLLKQDYDVAGYFFNPNIHPEEEYMLRLQEARRVAQNIGFELIEAEYDKENWLSTTHKLKDEPERGLRCDVCYAIRLTKTARMASELGFSLYTTVMSLSPLKKAATLNRIGRMSARRYKIDFLEADFKKKDGFKKSVELSNQHHLYRQNYCGCAYSMRQKRNHGSK